MRKLQDLFRTTVKRQSKPGSSRANKLALTIVFSILILSTSLGSMPASAEVGQHSGLDPSGQGCDRNPAPENVLEGTHQSSNNKWEIRYSSKCEAAWLRVHMNQQVDGYYYLARYYCPGAEAHCRADATRVTEQIEKKGWSDMYDIGEGRWLRACYSRNITKGPFESCSSVVEAKPNQIPDEGFGPLVIG